MVVLLILAILLFFPDNGFCFGPAFHLKIGYELINYLTLFSPLTQQLLQNYPLDFLYGNISPDIVIGKRFMPYHRHCHNWEIAKSLIEESKTEKERAFAYGYLAHLSSDVVAHNFFIPYQIISTFKTRTLTHLYWETRIDNKIDREIWYLAEKFKTYNFSDAEQMLERVLIYNLFPFKISKRIYKSYISFSSLEKWHQALNIVKNFSKYKIEPQLVDEVLTLSKELSLAAITRQNDDFLYKSDPMGRKALAMAQTIKKNLRAVHFIKPIDDETTKNLAIHFKNKLRKALYKPQDFAAIISEE